MRVAMVVPSLRGGGLERLVRDLVLGLNGDRFVFGAFGVGGLGVYADDLRKAGVLTVDCSPSGPRIRGVPLRLVKNLRNFAPHVIHAHSGTWYPASVAKTVLRDVSLVYTEHGRYPPEPMSRAVVERLCAHVTDRICAVSGETAEYLKRFLRLEETPEVLPNGVDLGRFRPPPTEERAAARAELGLDPRDVAGIAVGRFVPVKNHAFLVRGAKPVMERHSEFRLFFVGEGPLEQPTRRLVEEEGLESRIRFLGFREDVPRLLGACDFFVNGSTTEGQPVSILEAMAVGLPVVGTRVGGVPAVLGDPPAGILVRSGAVGELREALEEVVASPATRKEYTRRALGRVDDFSIERFFDRHAHLYRAMARLASPARGR